MITRKKKYTKYILSLQLELGKYVIILFAGYVPPVLIQKAPLQSQSSINTEDLGRHHLQLPNWHFCC